MRFNPVMIFVLLTVGVTASGCEKKAEVATPANKESFTGPEMPEEARAKMREAQAKAMAQAGAGAAPVAGSAPEATALPTPPPTKSE